MKRCTKCGETISLLDFGPDSRAIDGKQSSCRKCGNVARKKYRDSNKGKIAKYMKKWAKENPNSVSHTVEYKARQKLRSAVNYGSITKPSTCQGCETTLPIGQIQGL